MHHTWRVALATVLTTGLAAGLSGCALSSSGKADDDPKTVVVVTHDSWAMDKKVIAAFEKSSGYTVKVRPTADAGELTNRLVLTKDDPLGDVVYGIDNTFASRASSAGVLQDYVPKDRPASAASYDLPAESGAAQLTPVDYGDVCVNVDDAWFKEHGKTPPRTLDDLTDPAYRNLFVVPGATTSSPGLAFLLTTVAAKGEGGWQDYWRKLVANGVKVDAGWTNAYEVDFTGGGGKGDRPIVLSYASSPPFTIPKGKTEPDHQRAARHLLPPGRVRRRAGGGAQHHGCAGVRGLHAGQGVPGAAARPDVRVPGQRRGRAAAAVG